MRGVFISSYQKEGKKQLNELLKKLPEGFNTLIMYSDMLSYLTDEQTSKYFIGQWLETPGDKVHDKAIFILADCERIFDPPWKDDYPTYWCLEYPKKGGLMQWLRNHWEAITKTKDYVSPMLYFNEFKINNWFGAELMLLICRLMKLWLGERFVPIFPCFSAPYNGVEYPCRELWKSYTDSCMLYSLNGLA